MNNFNAKTVKDDIVKWIREFFEQNGKGCSAVVGISGGKDSSVVAALCVEALGKDKVFGVLMPNGEQADIDASYSLVKHLGIDYCVVNIHEAIRSLKHEIKPKLGDHWSVQTSVNLPARIRMATLYAVSQTIGGRVANTCNLSEDWVGYATRYGDGAGDFSPLSKLTVTEVKAIGRELGLPEELVEKVPTDGLCGHTDEDNLGFTYAVLDRYIRTGEIDDMHTKERIDTMHEKNMFKLDLMPSFEYTNPVETIVLDDKQTGYGIVGVYAKAVNKGAMFDARVFNIPKEEVTNNIYWRQLDASRNSVQMVGQANFSHRELLNKTCNQIQDMLMTQRGINWNDMGTSYKRGSCCVRNRRIVSMSADGTVTCEIRNPKESETAWIIDNEIPIFKGEGRRYIDELIFIGGVEI